MIWKQTLTAQQKFIDSTVLDLKTYLDKEIRLKEHISSLLMIETLLIWLLFYTQTYDLHLKLLHLKDCKMHIHVFFFFAMFVVIEAINKD